MRLRDPKDPSWRHYRDTLVSSLPAREGKALAAWAMSFYPFQLRWLFEPARLALCNKSRQIGISHTTGALGALWGAFFAETTTFVSIGEREAAEVLDKAKRHCEVLQELGSQWARFGRKPSTLELRLASGGRIIALPHTAAGRSFSGNVFLDEFAYHDHPDKVWDAAAPITLHGSLRMRVGSTPNGVGNQFHNLWTNPEASGGWWGHEIPLEMAQADGMEIDLEHCWSLARGDPRVFDQMFRCKFLDAEQQYIPTAAVAACSSSNCYTWDGEYYAGLDIGLENDLTALVVVRRRPDGLVVVQAIRTCKRTDQDAIDRLVGYAFRKYGLRRLCVDATGLGAFPTQALQRVFGATRVEAVQFSQPVKEDLATTMYRYFVDELVRVPDKDGVIKDEEPGSSAALREDVCSIRRIVLPTGNIRYDAQRTDRGHADRAWALALALHAISQRARPKTVTTDGNYEQSAA
jgi:phage FluMu gp28-like protein